MSTPQTFVVYARSFVGRDRQCKACRAPIEFWQLSDSDRWMPFDPGVVIVRSFQRDGDRVMLHEVAGVSHFSTCPAADRFRKKKAPAQPVMETLF